MTAINLGTRVADKTLKDHLAEWKRNARPELAGFVTKVAAVFSVKV